MGVFSIQCQITQIFGSLWMWVGVWSQGHRAWAGSVSPFYLDLKGFQSCVCGGCWTQDAMGMGGASLRSDVLCDRVASWARMAAFICCAAWAGISVTCAPQPWHKLLSRWGWEQRLTSPLQELQPCPEGQRDSGPLKRKCSHCEGPWRKCYTLLSELGF